MTTLRTLLAFVIVLILYTVTGLSIAIAVMADAPGAALFLGGPCFLAGSYILYRIFKSRKTV